MVEVLRKKSLLPLVVFCFSKARCDSSADGLTALDLTASAEKSEIHRFCDKAFSRLKGSDRKLPQVLRIQELLQRGIGCHHAGLLPIVKEVVELLFCRGLLKLLFSTETFAMGVNAPARTVAFHSVRKHDGKNFRTLLPGEYTQMAGRAGRRGLDKVGTVLLMCWDEIPEEAALRTLLTGQPTRLESQFRLTYNMILNLLRVEDLKVEDMLKRSFAEFHAQRALPQTQQQLRQHEASLAANQLNIECILGDPTIAAYYEYARQVEDLTAELTDAVLGSRGGQALMTSGRLIMVKTPDHPPTLGMVLREAPSRPPSSGATPSLPSYLVLGLHRGPLPPSSQTPPSVAPSPTPRPREADPGAGMLVGKRARDNLGGLDYGVTRGKLGARSADAPGVVKLPLPYHGENSGTGYFVAEVRASDIVAIGRDKVRVEVGRILESEAGPEAGAVGAAVQRLQLAEAELAGEPLPEVEPRELKMASLDAAELYAQRGALLAALAGNPCATCPVVPRHYREYRQHALLRERVRHLKHELSDDNLQQMPDFEQRVAVLQQLGYLDAERVVQIKGRVACEVNSGDELIAAEMILDNQLDDLEPAEAVALLSAFVFQDKSASEPELTATLAAARDRLAATALHLGKIQADHGLPIVPDDYLKGALNFGLMEVVYEWAQGTPFSDICALTDVPEGSIVRCIVRLDETCRETKNAARLIGNSSLYQKMEAASAAIKRDIVFAASLYVTGTASF